MEDGGGGALTENYEYVWDPFGRLRKVQTRDATPKLVAEYRYNGLGHRIGWHHDANTDAKTDSGDPWYYFVYDERWRIVATYRADDSDPKEQFVHHNAGLDGMGGSSYIDTVVLRDKDANTAWESASDGTLEERIYHCQNWRADVVALVDDSGELVEQDRYSSYGIPFGMHAGDVDSDGDVDASDASQINSWISSGYDVRGDLNLDGSVDSTDETKATNNNGRDLAWGKLSDVGGRNSLAGYQFDPVFEAVTRMAHVRHRVLGADLGRWQRRDPLGYIDGANSYQYVQSKPLVSADPSGQATPLLVILPLLLPPAMFCVGACWCCESYYAGGGAPATEPSCCWYCFNVCPDLCNGCGGGGGGGGGGQAPPGNPEPSRFTTPGPTPTRNLPYSGL